MTAQPSVQNMIDPAQAALHAAVLFATNPQGLGGIAVKAAAGPVRDAYLDFLKSRMPDSQRLRKIPLQIQDERLLGGLDLSATLNLGRPVMQQGLLAQAHGGVVLISMAERITPELAARIAAVMDQGMVQAQRDGLWAQMPARFGVIAFDEGITEDERLPEVLKDRLAFHVDLSDISLQEMNTAIDLFQLPVLVSEAMSKDLNAVDVNDNMLRVLCGTAMVLGVDSFRAVIFALRAVRSLAVIAGKSTPADDDIALAARLVLAPRATQLPPAADQQPEEDLAENTEDNNEGNTEENNQENNKDSPDQSPDEKDDDQNNNAAQTEPESLDDVVLEAVKAAIPAGLLAAMTSGAQRSAVRSNSSGRSGAIQKGGGRGRPIGSRAGVPGGRARLNLIDTLRTAAPWQRLRKAEFAASKPTEAKPAAAKPTAANQNAVNQALANPQVGRVLVRPQDFQITRFKQRKETTTIFVVDASGSSAIHRLAEAKGAVELLLADCYVRRDQVAVIAFRGQSAQVILPPTRSLVRAKRSLSGLPGGGGTPLALAIESAAALAQAVARKGDTPVIVMLTDARANIAKDGSPGRAQAQEDACIAARQIRAAGFHTLLIDTSPQPSELAQQIAIEMQARYLPLPHAGATEMSRAIKIMAAA